MGSNSGSWLYTLTELAGTMCGLQKALSACCCLQHCLGGGTGVSLFGMWGVGG